MKVYTQNSTKTGGKLAKKYQKSPIFDKKMPQNARKLAKKVPKSLFKGRIARNKDEK